MSIVENIARNCEAISRNFTCFGCQKTYLSHSLVEYNLPPFNKPKEQKCDVSSYPKFDRQWEKLLRSPRWKWESANCKKKERLNLKQDRQVKKIETNMKCRAQVQ